LQVVILFFVSLIQYRCPFKEAMTQGFVLDEGIPLVSDRINIFFFPSGFLCAAA
jgi:hypothetical protein